MSERRVISNRMFGIAAALVAACFMCVALAGCSGPTPTDTVKQAMEAIKAQNTDNLAQVYSGDASSISSEMMGSDSTSDSLSDTSDLTDSQKQVYDKLKQMFYDFDYTLSDEQIDGDTATVKVTVKAHDMGSAFSKAVSDTMSTALMYAFSSDQEAAKKATTDALYDALDTQLDAHTDKDTTNTATVTLHKQDGKWKIDSFDNEFYNAISGGLVDTISNMNSAFGSSSSSTSSSTSE